MLLFYAKYIFFFWLLIDSNQGDLMLMRQLSEDDTLLSLSACTKRCLLTKLQKNFEGCYDYCRHGNSTDLKPANLRKIQENFLLRLVCRTESKLSFRINWVQHARNNSSQSTPEALFIIKVNANDEYIMESLIYLSDDSFFTLPNLESNTAHNITALAVHADGAYSLIAIEEGYQTLRRGYQPSKMGKVKLRKFLEQPGSTHSIAAEIEWQPSTERNCFFDLIYFSTRSQSMGAPTPVEIYEPRNLYTYTIPNLDFSEQIRVGVRTVNPMNKLESAVQWLLLDVPNCLDWHNYNYTLCPPLRPTNLSVQQQHFEQDILALNISWALPKLLPDYYTLYILDLYNDSEYPKIRVAGNANHHYISNITIFGVRFEVHLVAHTAGGLNSTALSLNKIPLQSWVKESSIVKLSLFLFVSLCCIIALCLLTLRKQKRPECLQLETKDLKTAANQSSDFHLSLINSSNLLASLAAEDNFELDDELEVDPHAVLLQDVLGEGAFGLVRRGVYKQRQVAVKLLKDHPNEEDVQAFKCEIEMLRAVGRHPNIVSIVGYSTKCSNRMMLLTEYCGLGSLQNYLRDEWKFQQERRAQDMNRKFNPPKQTTLPAHMMRSRHFLYNDNRIEDINRSILSTLEEESETDLSWNSNKAAKGTLAADNKCYGLHDIENIDANTTVASLKTILKRSEKQPGRSFENQEYFNPPSHREERQPLKYADLLDIAQQVAVGMDFLAQNKIVHRDLAARNVLISSDLTIKIADFGLSRDVYHENVYRKSGGSGKLPIKWLALESLTHQVYTSQSDVWSFGVLLYEITTLGGMPYPSISPRDLLQLLRQGQRMKRPEGCTDEMFAMMESCWSSIPGNRPTFAQLKQRLDAMILATNEQPMRLQRQQQQLGQHTNLQPSDQNDNLHSKVEQLPEDDEPYLQPCA